MRKRRPTQLRTGFDVDAIASRRFGVVPRGFDQDEVLVFLNEIAVAVHEFEAVHIGLREEAHAVLDRARADALRVLERTGGLVDQAMSQIDCPRRVV